MQSEPAPLDVLTRTPYLSVLTYPRNSIPIAKSRVKQLKELGVEELIFEGHTRIGRLGILGLGTVGVVVKARSGNHFYALKIRRTDANRKDMAEEVRLTTLANRLGIGPNVQGSTRDLILIELFEYDELSDWLAGVKGPGSRGVVRALVHSLLNQCRTLDIMGIDHGQLSDLRKHAVVVHGRPRIIDFESAGTERRPKNVTTAAQHLLVGGRIAPSMRRALGLKDTKQVIQLLSSYKSDMSDYTYAKLLEGLRIA